jgi:hypothetical protein
MQLAPSASQILSKAKVESLEAVDTVILYDTIPAGQRGLSALAGIMENNLVVIRPRPLRLDFMNDPETLKNALRDLRAAHMIILSTNGDAPLPLAFKVWFAAILDLKKGNHAAVVMLFDLGEKPADAASRNLHFIKHVTLEAELDFFAPSFNG